MKRKKRAIASFCSMGFANFSKGDLNVHTDTIFGYDYHAYPRDYEIYAVRSECVPGNFRGVTQCDDWSGDSVFDFLVHDGLHVI
jgi:hypothetical protein